MGEPEELELVCEHVKGEETDFDFSKIVPGTPEGEGWYEWNCSNWGTKWNTGDVTVGKLPGRVEFIFDTAWSPPLPVLVALAAQFPSVNIEHMYAEAGMCFGGFVRYAGGESIESASAEDSRSVASLSEWHEMQMGFDEDDLDDAEAEDELFGDDEDEDEHEGGVE